MVLPKETENLWSDLLSSRCHEALACVCHNSPTCLCLWNLLPKEVWAVAAQIGEFFPNLRQKLSVDKGIFFMVLVTKGVLQRILGHV